ncbi:MAG: hypothetical protein AABW99_04410 [archaeon]
MFGIDKFRLGIFLLGMGLGGVITSLPAPLDVVNPFLSVALLLIGVVFLLMA